MPYSNCTEGQIHPSEGSQICPNCDGQTVVMTDDGILEGCDVCRGTGLVQGSVTD